MAVLSYDFSPLSPCEMKRMESLVEREEKKKGSIREMCFFFVDFFLQVARCEKSEQDC
jgi:hypothetical protein